MNLEQQRARLDERLRSASQHWEQRHAAATSESKYQPANARALTIALSREAGTDAAAVGRASASLLNWPIYDDELLNRIAQDMGVQKKLLGSIDERRRGWLEQALMSFMAVPFVSDEAFVHHLVKTILALGTHGECIIIGRGAAFILPPESTLRVRLIAPTKNRAELLSKQLGTSLVEATRHLEALDQERTDFVEDHFFKDPSALHNFNLVLDFARFGVDGCASVIAEAARYLQKLFEEEPAPVGGHS